MDTISSSSRRCSFRIFCKEFFYSFVAEYETPKIVMIHSYTMTTILRIMQIILLLYGVFYLLIIQKGYQKHDTSIISSVTLKVKGIGYIYTPKNQTYVFDGTDYIVPPSENNAIFIMTNFIQTEQSRSECVESISLPEAKCTKDTDCQNKPLMTNANGRWTGQCLLSPVVNVSNSIDNTTTQPSGLCAIQGWCPVEDDLQEPTLIQEILNVTIFIKNFIEFPTFHVKHKNIIDNLKPCIYDPVTSKECPIFRLDYILSAIEKNPKEQDLMLRKGGVIRVKLDWDCNLDRSVKLCKPLYSFARLDTTSPEETFSIGFNFRFASYWKRNRKYLRSLTKAYGLRFIISVSGTAGKLDLITLSLNIGSLVGIFGLATFFCDIILLNLTKNAAFYRDLVFQRVHDDGLRNNNNISLNTWKPTNNMDTVFENRSANSQRLPTSICSSERFLDTAYFSTPTDPSQLPRLQTSLGLTNLLNAKES